MTSLTTAPENDDFENRLANEVEAVEPVGTNQKNIIRIEDLIAQMGDRDEPSLDLDRFEEIRAAKKSGILVDLEPGELEAYELDVVRFEETMRKIRDGFGRSIAGVNAAVEKATSQQREVAEKMMASMRGQVGPMVSHTGLSSQIEAMAKQNEELSVAVSRRRAEREDREIANMEIAANQLVALKAVSDQLAAQAVSAQELASSMVRQEISAASAAKYARRRDWSIFIATVSGIVVAITLALVVRG